MLRKGNLIEIRKEWSFNKVSILISSIFVILSYLLTLYAFRLDKVSYVVALRQLGVIFGVILGSFVLKEEYGLLRLFASIIMFSGFVLVAVS